MAAIGAMLLLVAYIYCIPASIQSGWQWFFLVLCLPVAGPLWFCFRHLSAHRKPAWQLLVGSLLLICSVALLYGLGPTIAGRIMQSQGAAAYLDESSTTSGSPSQHHQ